MSSPKILHLTLKKKWFDMIKSGDKREEYRDIKPYWASRLIDASWTISLQESKNENKGILIPDIVYDLHNHPFTSPEEIIKGYFCKLKEFDFVMFRNGYSGGADLMSLECKGIEIREGKSEWGAPSGKCFIIKLGEIVIK